MLSLRNKSDKGKEASNGKNVRLAKDKSKGLCYAFQEGKCTKGELYDVTQDREVVEHRDKLKKV